MNKLKLILGFALFFFLASNVNAQSIPSVKTPKMNIPEMDLSTQVLGILNTTDGLGLNSDQKDKLTKENSSFVDQLMNISKSGKSDDDKKAAFLGLKNNRTKFLTSLLGNDLFKKYSGQILKSINPLKSKLGLAALAF
ncbi:hypothetical protein SAMN04489724_0798 [Algoriphagus locisalis]|uniref:DUF3347 domain-containing protein n=1 Tax=Algoriphagus locisalis TaxID=305507 RepID=A0A1I6Y3G3_9BACT|nr:hypothetical protein [Algoriphagus locisalis]SFT44771.1 hypothetical protein SAMN04489724_0798 [Algoriphagus locisalis]